MNRVIVVTDSNSGITQSEAKELGVVVMPMPFYINGQMFYEDIDLTQEQFYQKLKEEKLDARLILQVHDELIVEASEECAERAAVILNDEMEHATKLSVPLIADVNKGRSWYDAKG